MKAGRPHEDRRKSRRGSQPADLGSGLPSGHHDPAVGSTGLEALVTTPKWWPFTYTTKDNLKRLKRQHAALTIKRWLRMPPAPF